MGVAIIATSFVACVEDEEESESVKAIREANVLQTKVVADQAYNSFYNNAISKLNTLENNLHVYEDNLKHAENSQDDQKNYKEYMVSYYQELIKDEEAKIEAIKKYAGITEQDANELSKELYVAYEDAYSALFEYDKTLVKKGIKPSDMFSTDANNKFLSDLSFICKKNNLYNNYLYINYNYYYWSDIFASEYKYADEEKLKGSYTFYTLDEEGIENVKEAYSSAMEYYKSDSSKLEQLKKDSIEFDKTIAELTKGYAEYESKINELVGYSNERQKLNDASNLAWNEYYVVDYYNLYDVENGIQNCQSTIDDYKTYINDAENAITDKASYISFVKRQIEITKSDIEVQEAIIAQYRDYLLGGSKSSNSGASEPAEEPAE